MLRQLPVPLQANFFGDTALYRANAAKSRSALFCEMARTAGGLTGGKQD
jgi:hypothetical protein